MRRLNAKDWQANRLSYLKDAAQVLLDGLADTVAAGYVKSYGPGRNAAYLVFYGKQSKPKVYYSAPNVETARTRVLEKLQQAKRYADQEAADKLAKKNRPKDPYTTSTRRGITCREYDTAGTAQLIREALKAAFPGVKFSVRSSVYSMGSSVHISYTDGPAYRDVDAICDKFQYGDFDGSDDSYNHRDESVLVDESGPYYVRYGAKYVSVQREFSACYGRHCYHLDLRTRPSLADQLEAYYEQTRRQYSFGDVQLASHEAGGSFLLAQNFDHEQVQRLAAGLRLQGENVEVDTEGPTIFLAVYRKALTMAQ